MTDDGNADERIGEFFESIQVMSADRELVLRELRETLRSMGFVPVDPNTLPPYEGAVQDEIETEARRFFVGPAEGGWVPLFPSSDLPEQLAMAQLLSERTHRPTLVLNLHNGDVFYYWLFEEGKLLDQYDSNPGYFDEPRSVEELSAVRGHPKQLASILPPGVAPEDVEAILTQTLDNAAEATDQHGVVLWGDEQFDEFTRLLHIPNAAHSYEDAKLEGLEGFVEHPEEFVEIGFSPAPRGNGSNLGTTVIG